MLEQTLIITALLKSFLLNSILKGFLTISVKKSLLLLLFKDLNPDNKLDELFKEYEIEPDPTTHSDIMYIFNEFKTLKKKLKVDLELREPLKNEKTGEFLNPMEIYDQVEGYKLRLKKLNLMMKRELLVTHNVNKLSGVKYVVVRSNWLDKKGNKYRKFSKNLGSEEKLLVRGEIPPYKMKEALDDITRMMWEQYTLEYLT